MLSRSRLKLEGRGTGRTFAEVSDPDDEAAVSDLLMKWRHRQNNHHLQVEKRNRVGDSLSISGLCSRLPAAMRHPIHVGVFHAHRECASRSKSDAGAMSASQPNNRPPSLQHLLPAATGAQSRGGRGEAEYDRRPHGVLHELAHAAEG